MDFAFLPPEINSARMYTGPGSGSMQAAASSWTSLATDLGTTAVAYEGVLADLASWQWTGPAAQAMTVAATHYVGWLQFTAEQASQTAAQAQAAAAAYEQAYALTVPPPAITANRTQLATLIATNLVGQNTAAIAAAEAQYAEYWAQDSAAMSGYSISSQTASRLSAFVSPNPATTESGLSAQSAAVGQAAASAAAADPVSQLVQSVTQSLQSLLTSGSIIPDDLTVLDVIAATGTSINSSYYVEAFASGVIGAENNLGVLPKLGATAAAEVAPAVPSLAAAPQLGGAAGLGNITATLSRAGSIGQMSVPAGWVAPSAPARITEFTPAGFTTIPGTDESVASGYPGYPGVPGGAASRSGLGTPPRYGVRHTVMPRPPAAG